MIVDTSVWIAYLSTSESLASRWLADRIAADSTVIVPEAVRREKTKNAESATINAETSGVSEVDLLNTRPSICNFGTK
ncbi:hypothetical protein ABLN86_21905, partial [Mycobacterium tuberculosis]